MKLLLLPVALFCTLLISAQPVAYSFHTFTAADGLNDGFIRSMAQDKYGFMWFGTINGITVYNGYNTRIFDADRHNSFALKNNIVSSICKDKNGTMWIGQESGLYEYDYATAHFIVQSATASLPVRKILSAGSILYLVTPNGLKAFNTQSKKIIPLTTNAASLTLLNKSIKNITADKHNNFYLATDTGIVVYNSIQKTASLLQTKTVLKNMEMLVVDNNQNLWCSDRNVLYKIDTTHAVTIYKNFTNANKSVAENNINYLLIDNTGKLWLATTRMGIGLYNQQSDTFNFFNNDPLQPQSISTNLILSLFQSNDGTIWMGTEGYGVNYFNPQFSFFHRLQPSFHQSPTLPDNWCRAALEDKQHNWWLATASGVAKYNPLNNAYTIFQNKESEKKLYANSVRSIFCASNEMIWIGTSDGLNRYNPATNTIDFISEKEMPLSFYWSIAEDSSYNIWFGSRDGIYTYNTSTKHFDDNTNNTLLKPYCKFRTRLVFVDSRHRLWFGFDGKGLLLYDAPHTTVHYFNQQDSNTTSLTYNTVTAIAEDKNGAIWVSTSSGLNAYDETKNSFHQYTKANGLPSNKISELVVDRHNRLWMTTGAGLCMLDSSRKKFTSYPGESYASYNDQTATTLANGSLMFPTLKGFLYFNPDSARQPNTTIHTYLTAFRVNNKLVALNNNYESVTAVHLKWNENFFAFTLTAPDYIHAQQTTYAFRLVPFDKDWIYINEQTRNYTNVPGGDYVLHFKALYGDQASPEQTISIQIDTVFYKQTWFIFLITLLFIAVVYAMYRYRINHLQKLSSLQSKTQALEKEKTLVMYESLKQQLNPHFLFNSLSSLSGLIQKDQAAAKLFLDKLSKLYRYILRSSDVETVSVSEDLKLAETYVQLQQTRFGKGLQLIVNIGEQYLTKKIAPVTLQNLIENAIKHNIIDAESPLVISISTDNNYLIVTNNLQKKSFVESSNKQGLKNMSVLYKYLCGKPIVQQETAEHFIIKIPFV